MGNAADFGKRTKLILIGSALIIGGGITFGILTFVKRSKLQVQEQDMDSWLGGKDASKLTEYSIPIVAGKVEEGVKAGIGKLLDERNYNGAAQDYFVNISLLDRIGSQYPDFKVSADKTVTTWNAEVRVIIADSILGEMQRILGEMGSGETISSARIDDFIHNFHKFGDYEQRFEASKPALSRARAKHAVKWLRVPPAHSEGFEIIRGMLEQQFDSGTGYTLVFAPPYGPEEAKATWRTLNVDCQPLQSISESTPTDQYIFDGPPSHVIGYFIYFKMEGSPKVRTTWDKMRDSSNVRDYDSVEEFVREEIPKFAIK